MDGGDGAVAAFTVKSPWREGIHFLNEKKVGICYRGGRREAAGHSRAGICLNHFSENWGAGQEQVS